jgi:hypothetical protein
MKKIITIIILLSLVLGFYSKEIFKTKVETTNKITSDDFNNEIVFVSELFVPTSTPIPAEQLNKNKEDTYTPPPIRNATDTVVLDKNEPVIKKEKKMLSNINDVKSEVVNGCGLSNEKPTSMVVGSVSKFESTAISGSINVASGIGYGQAVSNKIFCD